MDSREELRSIWLSAPFLVALVAGVVVAVGYGVYSGGMSDDPAWLFGQPQKFLVLAVLYPIIEEISFRGVLQGVLLKYPAMRTNFANITIANILTSIAFASIHLVHHSHIWALMIFVPSLIFGYFRDITGGVQVSVVLHVFYNLVFLSMNSS